jgi:hypothetical protein
VLPPVESLTPESDFAAFMQPKVDEGVKRQALKKLFADPRFNVMDGLDVYIDDYTKPDPIPPDVLERLAQSGFVRGLGAPPVEEPAPPAQAPLERAPGMPALTDDARAPTSAADTEPPPATSVPAGTPGATADSAGGGAEASDPPSRR